MASFVAPVEANEGWMTYGTPESEQANLLWRHYGPRNVGVNVYVLNDDTVTQNAPDGTTITWADVRTVFWGGHVAVEITGADRSALVAAGYTVID